MDGFLFNEFLLPRQPESSGQSISFLASRGSWWGRGLASFLQQRRVPFARRRQKFKAAAHLLSFSRCRVANRSEAGLEVNQALLHGRDGGGRAGIAALLLDLGSFCLLVCLLPASEGQTPCLRVSQRPSCSGVAGTLQGGPRSSSQRWSSAPCGLFACSEGKRRRGTLRIPCCYPAPRPRTGALTGHRLYVVTRR